MRKKILSAVLALCIVLTLIPAPALAVELERKEVSSEEIITEEEPSKQEVPAGEKVLNLDDGDITITVDQNGTQTVSQGQGEPAEAQNLVITGEGLKDNVIAVETAGVPARFTLRDLTAETSDRPTVEMSGAEAEITIAGDVDLMNDSAPIFHVTTGALTLLGDGVLIAAGGAFYASFATIGGGERELGEYDTEPEDLTGSITIGGSVTAVITNEDGPALGAGGSVSGNISITDHAEVEVTSNGNTAIGSGAGDYSSVYPMSGTISVDGSATVTVESGSSTAIGSGYKSPMSGTISIGGKAIVKAVLAGEGYSAPGAAAIGSGEGAEMSGNIFISGNVNVQAQAISGAGIGSGKNGLLSGRVAIRENATVDAQSGSGASIGSGESGEMMGSLELSGKSSILAAGLESGAAIGSGHYGEMGGDIFISGNACIETRNAKKGAGIGSGESGKLSGYISIQDMAQVLSIRESRDAVDIGAGNGGQVSPEYDLSVGPRTVTGALVEFPLENDVRQIELRGRIVVDQELSFRYSENNYDFTVLPGSSLEISQGAQLNMNPDKGAGRIINQGKILNNGVIRLTKPTDEAVDIAQLVRDMHLEGLGHVAIMEGSGWGATEAVYSNSGETSAQTTEILNFTDHSYEGAGTGTIVSPVKNATLDTNGYQLSEDGKTLTIQNLNIQGLILPSDMTLVLKGSNTLSSNMSSHYVDNQRYSDYFVAIFQPDGGSLTITTEAGVPGYLKALHGNSGAENLCNADTLTIKGDAQITANILACGNLSIQDNVALTLNKNIRASGDMVLNGNANVYVAVSDKLVGYSGGYPAALYAKSLQISGGRLHLEGAYEESWSSVNTTMALLLTSDCVEKLKNVTITLPELKQEGKLRTAQVGDVTVTSVVPANQKQLKNVGEGDLNGTAATGSNAVRVLELAASDLVTISFEPNGGEGKMEQVTLAKGYYTLPASGFDAPQGKQFQGWAVNTLDSDMVKAFTTILVDQDTTLYALWEKTPLIFVDSRSYDVPIGEVGTPIKAIDLSAAVSGGTEPYVFSLKEKDSWLELSAEGVLSGQRPMEAQEARDAVICVTDAKENQAEIIIRVGALVPASPEQDSAAIRVGTSGMTGAQRNRSKLFGAHSTPTSHVFFGQYEGAPVCWRVLDSEKDNTGADGGVFLLSENYMGQVDLSTKSGSKTWCDAFANGAGLSAMEQKAVRRVSKQDWPMNEFGWDNWKNSNIQNEQVFFLSAQELEEYVASFDEWDLLGTGNARRGTWLLRSPMFLSGNREAMGAVNGMDYVNCKELKDGAHASARPALNLEQGKVLFASTLGQLQQDSLYDTLYHEPGAKAGRSFGLKQVEVKASNDWKLTLLDDSRSQFTAAMDGNTVTWSNAKVGDNEYISALICDVTGAITHYGRLCRAETSTGSVAVDLTGINMEGKSLHIINEQYNGGRSDDTLTTDLSSPMIWVSGVCEHTVTIEKTQGGTGYASPASAMPGLRVNLSAAAEEGYEFKEWEILEGQLELREDNSFIMPEEDVVLRPVFTEKSSSVIPAEGVLITFDAMGGTVSPYAMRTDANGHLVGAPRPSRDGYLFQGWFTTEQYGGDRVTGDTVFLRNTTVYARWRLVEEDNYVPETSDPTPAPTPVKPDPKPSIPDVKPGETKTETKPDGTKVEASKDKQGNTTVTEEKPNGDKTVTETKKDGTEVKTETNKSGDKTVTETKKDGSSVKTEEKANGDKAVTETKKDGSSVKTEEKANGDKAVTETRKDGSSTKTEDKANGDKAVTETRKDGSSTKTENKANGDKAVTETKKDGSSVKIEDKANGDEVVTKTDKSGASVSEGKKPDGTTAKSTTTAAGKTEVKTEISKKAVEQAQESQKPIEVPVAPVEVSQDRSSAPVVEIEISSETADVKVSIPVENPSAGTVAVLVHPDGREEIVKKSTVDEKGVALKVSENVTVKIVDNSKDFQDIPKDHWAESSIDFVTSRELFNGTSTETFTPNAPTTRGQLMTVLARLEGADTSKNPIQQGMEWAKQAGISDGTNAGGTISRQQLATMLWRLAGEPKSGKAISNKDAHKISQYAVDAMAWAVEQGILSGYQDGTLNPQGTASRAHVAAMVQRYVNK